MEGKALVAAKKRAQAAAGGRGGGGSGEGDEGDDAEPDEDEEDDRSGASNVETFNFTGGVGGEFRPTQWSDAAPRACDTWSDGPYKHVGGANASIHKVGVDGLRSLSYSSCS